MRGELWFARVVTLGALLALVAAGLYPGNNPDTFGHLAQGRQIAELGHVPDVDTWSLLPGPPRPWYNYEWLSDLGTYLLYAKLGYAAVTGFKCLLLAATVLALTRLATLLGGPRAALLTGLTIISTIPAIRVRLSDRPHVVGICLAALYLLLLTLLTRAPRSLRSSAVIVGALTLLHVVWVNVHGSHLLGLAITGSFLLFSPRGSLAATLALQIVGACCSPYGPAIVFDALDHVADPRYRALITEWLPWRDTDPAWLQLGPALQGAMLTLLAPRLVRRSHIERAMLLVALMLGIASFRSIRFIAEFMLLSAPLLGVGLALLSGSLETRRFVPASCAALIGVGGAALWGARELPPNVGVGVGISYAGLPQASAAALARAGDKPRILASMQDSWFMMFAVEGARFVVDGRVPFYGPEHIQQVGRAFTRQSDFDRVVDQFNVNVVVAGHAMIEDHELARFGEQRGFSLRLIEDQHALYTRADALRPEAARQLAPLVALRPSYALDWILSADADTSAHIRSELAQLARYPGTGGFRAWVEAVLTLAPLRRRGSSDGFHWPQSEDAWAVYRKALPLLARASQSAGDVPVVSALYGYVAAILCEFEVAERAVARAMREGAAREPLLVTQELRLRQGRAEEVRALVTAARTLPDGKDDPWLAELAQGVEVRPECP